MTFDTGRLTKSCKDDVPLAAYMTVTLAVTEELSSRSTPNAHPARRSYDQQTR